ALTIPLPPLAEQKVIADKLDTLLAQVETTKARLEGIPQILKTFRQSVLAAAVSGKLTEEWRVDNPENTLNAKQFLEALSEINAERPMLDIKRIGKVKNSDWFYDKSHLIPKGWVQADLIEITSLITCGVAKKPNYIEEGIPFLSAQNSKPFTPNLNKIKYVSEDDFRTFTVGGGPKKGDVLYSRVGANFGEACVVPWDFDFAIYVSLTLIKPIHKFLDSEYLTIFLNSLDGVLQSRGGIMGSGIQNLNVESVRKYKILLPSIDEQTQIVRRVEELFAFADRIEQKANAALERVNNLTQSILAKAFRGELTADWRAQNPDLISGDNSAEALLAKIKAEREALSSKKKPKKKAGKIKTI
ncbi:MAG: restriction endonuclease subunit S, partial [Cognaticolwellia aestuarii]